MRYNMKDIERNDQDIAQDEQPNAESMEAPDEQAEQSPLQNEITEEERFRLEHAELKDKYLRLMADFENYKRRMTRERIEWMNSAARDTMLALLPVLDDFDRAKKVAESEGGAETFSEGVGLIYQKLYNALRAKGLEPMESDGEPFDPELHEAVTEIPAPAEEQKGRVIDTIEKGYKLYDKIIRHAKVVVGM
jgi:molecular chaperone GrpE